MWPLKKEKPFYGHTSHTNYTVNTKAVFFKLLKFPGACAAGVWCLQNYREISCNPLFINSHCLMKRLFIRL